MLCSTVNSEKDGVQNSSSCLVQAKENSFHDNSVKYEVGKSMGFTIHDILVARAISFVKDWDIDSKVNIDGRNVKREGEQNPTAPIWFLEPCGFFRRWGSSKETISTRSHRIPQVMLTNIPNWYQIPVLSCKSVEKIIVPLSEYLDSATEEVTDDKRVFNFKVANRSKLQASFNKMSKSSVERESVDYLKSSEKSVFSSVALNQEKSEINVSLHGRSSSVPMTNISLSSAGMSTHNGQRLSVVLSTGQTTVSAVLDLFENSRDVEIKENTSEEPGDQTTERREIKSEKPNGEEESFSYNEMSARPSIMRIPKAKKKLRTSITQKFVLNEGQTNFVPTNGNVIIPSLSYARSIAEISDKLAQSLPEIP